MLLKSKISNLEFGSEHWKQARISKMTASKASSLCKPRGISMSYIREKVGEAITRVPAEKEIDNDTTRHGILYEPEAIKKFGEKMGIEFLVTQKMICNPESMFSATPDCIWVKRENSDGLSYEVSCGEVKCFPTYSHYVEMAECETPEDVLKADDDVFWQIVAQMVECDCLVGYAIFYHPDFPEDKGGLRIIEFRKMALIDRFKFYMQRRNEAVGEFIRIYRKLTSQSPTVII